MLAVTKADRPSGMLNHVRTSTPDRRPPALAVERLTKRFGDRVAFQDVSFEVGRGEVFGLLGPNGAGKTTTVRTLGTLTAPTSGSATVAGLPLTPENGVEIRRRFAIMPETPGLYLYLSVAENLECFAFPDELDERLFARSLGQDAPPASPTRPASSAASRPSTAGARTAPAAT